MTTIVEFATFNDTMDLYGFKNGDYEPREHEES